MDVSAILLILLGDPCSVEGYRSGGGAWNSPLALVRGEDVAQVGHVPFELVTPETMGRLRRTELSACRPRLCQPVAADAPMGIGTAGSSEVVLDRPRR